MQRKSMISSFLLIQGLLASSAFANTLNTVFSTEKEALSSKAAIAILADTLQVEQMIDLRKVVKVTVQEVAVTTGLIRTFTISALAASEADQSLNCDATVRISKSRFVKVEKNQYILKNVVNQVTISGAVISTSCVPSK